MGKKWGYSPASHLKTTRVPANRPKPLSFVWYLGRDLKSLLSNQADTRGQNIRENKPAILRELQGGYSEFAKTLEL